MDCGRPGSPGLHSRSAADGEGGAGIGTCGWCLRGQFCRTDAWAEPAPGDAVRPGWLCARAGHVCAAPSPCSLRGPVPLCPLLGRRDPPHLRPLRVSWFFVWKTRSPPPFLSTWAAARLAPAPACGDTCCSQPQFSHLPLHTEPHALSTRFRAVLVSQKLPQIFQDTQLVKTKIRHL